MRAKNMILFVIAIGCGLVASIGVSQYMDQASGASSTPVDTVKIFVAVSDINIGEKLDAKNVKLEEWPRDRLPEGTISDLETLDELYPRTRLYSGEPILRRKLMNSRDRGSKAVTIPEGYRVVSVRVTVDTAVAGLIEPGDRVDLLLFVRKGSEVPQTGTRTILRDVNVFGVDGETERSLDEDGHTRNLRTVSLLVTPKQAETVMLASELGTLSLTLRRPNESSDYVSKGETIQSLLGTAAESANEKKDANFLPVNVGLSGWPGGGMAAGSPLGPNRGMHKNNADEGQVGGPAWTMKILTPGGYREFEWIDENQLPREVDVNSVRLNPVSAAARTPASTTQPPDTDTPQALDLDGGAETGSAPQSQPSQERRRDERITSLPG